MPEQQLYVGVEPSKAQRNKTLPAELRHTAPEPNQEAPLRPRVGSTANDLIASPYLQRLKIPDTAVLNPSSTLA